MKKFASIILSLAFFLVLLVGIITIAPNTSFLSLQIYSAEDVDENPSEEPEGPEDSTPPAFPVTSTFFEYIHISQPGAMLGDGHLFTQSDFVYEPNTDKFTIYTNQTITIYCNYTGENSLLYNYSIYADGDYLKEDNAINYESPFVKQIEIGEENSRVYFVFDASKLSSDTKTSISIVLKFNNQQPDQTLMFDLVQTTNNFYSGGSRWEYTYNNAVQSITAPSLNSVYPTISLYTSRGSTLNPIYVRFHFCGEVFEVYNIDGEFYNSYDDEVITDNAGSPIDHLDFTRSGTYQVDIFDKTYQSGYTFNNYVSYSFMVENTTTAKERFYFNVHTQEGNVVMNNQISNSNIIVEFKNLSYIRYDVQDIEVRRDYNPTVGESIPITTHYSSAEILDTYGGALTFTEDGNYTIKLFLNGQADPLEFNFWLILNIRARFRIDNDTPPFEIGESEPANVTRRQNIEMEVESNYNAGNYSINSKFSYSFYVILARSAPSIDGVGSNARTSNSVSIVVRGVGNLQVTISQDGKTYTRECENGDRLPTFSDPGRYFIRVVDQMGTTVTKSFTITVKMNTAAIILIVLACLLVIGLVVFIIISRSKVKVR